MYKSGLLAVVLGFVFSIHALGITASAGSLITGEVRDKKSGEAIIGATVQIENSSVATATDLDGKFIIMVKNIEKAIEQLDSDNAKVYQNNAENYIKKLDTLDKQYANTIQNAKYKAILFGDRFPFRYMADDYDLKYYAAFAGCSAETMAGFETVTFLAKKADELRLPVILTIENSDGRIAEAVKSNTTKKNQKILAMNSLQSVTKEQIADGITYLQVMQENLSVLSEALN